MAAQPEGEEWVQMVHGALPAPTHGVESEVAKSEVATTGVAETTVAKIEVATTGVAGTGGGGPDPVAVALEAVQGLGLDEVAASAWVELLCAKVAADGTEAAGVPVPSTDDEVLTAMSAMARSAAALDASLLVSVQDLVLRTGSRLLSERGVVDPGTLSKTAHQTWRVNVKSAVAGELQVLLGVSPWEARQLVSVATYPGLIRSPILAALRRGEVTRRLVTAFHVATRRLDVSQAAGVSMVMFGTDAGMAAVERLAADGRLRLDQPWHHQEFHAALRREVTKVEAEDEDAAEEQRRSAFEGRFARMDLEDDGTASLTCTMATATAVAVYGRLEGMARRARAGGDRRALTQLRSDLVAVLLLHGAVTLPGDPQGCAGGCLPAGAGTRAPLDEIITPEDVEALQAIITATPAGKVDLVVPWDALVGAVCPRCRGPVGRTEITDSEQECAGGPGPEQGRARGPGPGQECAHKPDAGQRCAHKPDAGQECALKPDPGQECAGGEASGRHDPCRHATGARSSADSPHSRCPGRARCHDGVGEGASEVSALMSLPVAGPEDQRLARAGELIAWESAFITPRQARAIVLTPGSVLGRLLTDPEDGRCLERSISRYTPDAQMRRQVRAADVYGRGPGSRRPALQCELDHEKEWLTHGWTSEVNLNAKARLDHARKTKGLWRSVMNRRRDVTWTTLLGQVATTRGHDYRQYVDRVAFLAPYGPPRPRDGDVDRADLAARRDLLNQLVYAAIVHRRPGERAEADDDVLGSEDWLSIGDWGHLHHTDAGGQRRPGPPPSHRTPEQILGLLDNGPPLGSGAQGIQPSAPRTDSIRRAPDAETPPF